MNFKLYLYTILAILFCFNINAQNINSLNDALKNAKHDTTRSKILIDMTELLYLSKEDTVIPLCNEALLIIEKNLKNANQLEKRSFLKTKLRALHNISGIYVTQGEMKLALEYCEKGLEVGKETKDMKGTASSYYNMGLIYKKQGNIEKSLENYTKSLKIREDINDKKGAASCLNGLAVIQHNRGNINLALDCHHRSLKLREELNDKRGTALSLNNIGNIYEQQGDASKALEYYLKALKIQEEINDKYGISMSLNNIGATFMAQKKYTLAEDYYNKSLLLCYEIKNNEGIYTALNNLAEIYSKENNIEKECEYYERALQIAEKIGNKRGIAGVLSNLALTYAEQNKLEEGKALAEKSYNMSKELNDVDKIAHSSYVLSQIYAKMNNWKDAYLMREIYKSSSDSLTSITNRKASFKKELQYEYERKEEIAKVEFEKQQVLKNIQIEKNKQQLILVQQKNKLNELNFNNVQLALNQKKAESENQKKEVEILSKDKQLKEVEAIQKNKEFEKQKVIRNSFIGGFVLVLVLALFVLRSYIQKQKANKELAQKNTLIEQQKHLVEEKHKEITDSINYAERIQRSLLASENILNDNLNEYFVFFQPKDIVSGDFYWANKLSNNQFALVTADSTGHGVPGAIMSILNVSCLEKATEAANLTKPADILNYTRTKIIETLKKDGTIEGGKDGMDCSLISFDITNSNLTYSAANNPIWIIRDEKIMEFAPDKMPVGKHDRDSVSFTEHAIELKKNDMIYTLTDGMPDQFGGLKGKKFMYKQLKELLISIAHLSMQNQKEMLANTLNNWKGNIEQVDDITIIGIRI